MSRMLALGLLTAASAAVVGCGGGSSSSSAPPPPPPASYTVGGSISGLSGTGLVLQDNGGDNLNATGKAFTFATAITSGNPYAVTVLTQPSNPAQTCTVTSGSGTVTMAITTVVVTCTTAAGSSNVAPVTVDAGPSGLPANTSDVNTVFVTVTVCAPGNSGNCQNIDHVEIDTASFGLRLMSAVLNPTVASALPQVKETTSGNPLTECAQFADGYSWGSIRTATVNIASESAASIEVQVIGDPTYAVPATCGVGLTQEDTVASFGANGILGIGPLIQDCGPNCVTNASNGVYYNCPTASTCTESAVSLAQQISNPIVSFATDNNGAIIELPSLINDTAQTVAGSLIFGIGTEGNNALGGQTVITTNPGSQTVNTAFEGAMLTQSYIDTGSNGLFFPNTTTITECTNSTGFYCPPSTLNFTGATAGTISGVAGSEVVDFSIANADTLSTMFPKNTAFDDIGGPSVSNKTFDWGLPFFFGRKVYIAIQGQTTSAGPGPYYAF